MNRVLIHHLTPGEYENRDEKGVIGWYFERHIPKEQDYLVVFKCPRCRQHSYLTLHTIDNTGEVNASILCNGIRKTRPVDPANPEGDWVREPCDYHEFVILDEWPENLWKPAGQQFAIPV